MQYPSRDATRLSTTKEMLNIKVVQWEEAIESVQVGHDVYTKGRSAGYRPQQSLQETLKFDYSEIKVIVETTPEQALSIFTRLCAVVQTQLNRLEHKDSSIEKMNEIVNAIRRLAAAIAHKYNTPVEGSTTLSAREKTYVDSIDLYSFNTMLDARISNWSLRQALNLSSDSLISRMFGLQEALWGKATSLQNVEQIL